MKKAIVEKIENLKARDPRFLEKPMPDDIKSEIPVVTMEDCKVWGLHFTTEHKAKMSGMVSFSTSCKCGICPQRINSIKEFYEKETGKSANGLTKWEVQKFVRKLLKSDPMRTDISICWFCFSDAQQTYMPSLVGPLTKNFTIWNSFDIHPDWLPIINARFFRYEAFGDFGSIKAVRNAYTLARKNPETSFTAWTKNYQFFVSAEKYGDGKPKNFTLIRSSRYINRVDKTNTGCDEIFDHVFTVYTPEYAQAHGIEINCGARACLACLKCYTENHVFYINEHLK